MQFGRPNFSNAWQKSTGAAQHPTQGRSPMTASLLSLEELKEEVRRLGREVRGLEEEWSTLIQIQDPTKKEVLKNLKNRIRELSNEQLIAQSRVYQREGT